MASRKLSVALAAVLLGLQFGSPSVAAVAAEDLELIESYILSGEVEMLMGFLLAHPEFLELAGGLGDALRGFWADPSPAALLAVADVTRGGVTLAMLAPGDVAGVSIY